MPSLRAWILTSSAVLAFAPAQRARAQAPDSVACRQLLNAPVADSISLTVGVTMRSFDPAIKLDPGYRAEVALGLREMLRPPTPLPLTVYDQRATGHEPAPSSGITFPTIFGTYAVDVLRDGRMVNPRVTGGARAVAFDDAVLHALQALSDSGLFPSRRDSSADTLQLRFSIAPIDSARQDTAHATVPQGPAEPLFRMRVPALGGGKDASPMPGNRGPHYPDAARAARVEGRVVLEFVVAPDGRGDVRSVQVLEGTGLEFVSSVLTAFPTIQFYPAELGGCHVASVVRMPFTFSLSFR